MVSNGIVQVRSSLIFNLLLLPFSLILWDMDCTAHSGLAAMPCAIHLSLQRQGIVPKSALKTLYDYVILVFCACVMVVGCLMAVKEIIQGH